MQKRSVPVETLRIGMMGSGFVAKFHLQAMIGVRNVRVAGVWSPTAHHRNAFADRANKMELGPCQPYSSPEAMIASPEIDAVWVLSPNYARLGNFQVIHDLVKRGKASLRGVACEKPLARTIGEAREIVRLVKDARLNHGYLENQLFATAVQRGKEIIWRRAVPISGRPYLARAAEEHSGPHEPWFWRGSQQGGGVLSDMMCHSVEVARFLLTKPGEARSSLKPVSASATIGFLKWTRPEYVKKLKKSMGPAVDYGRHPAEDFARGTLVLKNPEGREVIIEATTSWAYVGAGLRLQLELLGPEYSMEFNSLSTGLKIFLSRDVRGAQGEDLVEKQNAEQGLMPVLEDEAAAYGYVNEDRHMVEAFRQGIRPMETLDDGLAVVEMLIALYRSAEIGKTVNFPLRGLEKYVPSVARKK
ncbi:MAG: Gfo/Idh/MocA family protein [Planctomycetaceae bacterium]